MLVRSGEARPGKRRQTMSKTPSDLHAPECDCDYSYEGDNQWTHTRGPKCARRLCADCPAPAEVVDEAVVPPLRFVTGRLPVMHEPPAPSNTVCEFHVPPSAQPG